MKTVYGLILALFLAVAPVKAVAGVGCAGEPFSQIMYFEHGGKGSASGMSEANAAAIEDKDVMAIPAKTMITKVYAIIDTAVTGSTAIALGDDDSASGYVPSNLLVHGTPGIYGFAPNQAGSYTSIQPGGVYAVPSSKLYTAAGKEVKIDVTGASSAGKFRVVVEGFRFN